MKRSDRPHAKAFGTQWPLKFKSSILILPLGILLSLPFVGCGVVMPEGEYEAPQLPKSELATIKIDTEGGWLQRYHLIVFRIDGKLAVSKNIEGREEVAIDDEILVAPGKHGMSLLAVYKSFHEDTPSDHQVVSRFSADVEAGRTYLLTGELSSEFNLKSKLVDTNGDKVVSKPKRFIPFEFSGSL